MMPTARLAALTLAAALVAAAAAPVAAQPAARPATPPAAAGANAPQTKTMSIPARGLFEGDKLSALARAKLAELVVNAIGLQVDVALLVPTGPWRIDGSGADERDLTPARLAAVKAFLHQRGVDPKHIYVESRVDEKIAEPRLDVQIIGRPAND
jgi:OOP family OmpA-OmpF porin